MDLTELLGEGETMLPQLTVDLRELLENVLKLAVASKRGKEFNLDLNGKTERIQTR